MTQPDFDHLPLRERKFARTKLDLLNALLKAIRSRSLEDVTVKEICAAAMISEASFFNYFPRKTDMLVYYVQLWSLRAAWRTTRVAAERGGRAALEELFLLTARELREHREAMAEIVAFQARITETPAFGEVTLAERLLAFPDLEGIEQTRAQGLRELLPPLLEQAIARGELPRRTDRPQALLGLAALFFGLPVALRLADTERVEAAYRTQFDLLWSGLRATHAETT